MNHAGCDHPATKAGRAACRRRNIEGYTASPLTGLDQENQLKIRTLKIRALDLMEEHGLTQHGWTLVWDSAKRRLGGCKYMTQEITLSMPMALVNDLSVMTNTIKHEIAHALVGPGHGHDEVWQMRAILVGAVPEAICMDNEPTPPRYIAKCAYCGEVYGRYKKTRKMSHLACTPCCVTHNGGKWSEKFLLTFKENQ